MSVLKSALIGVVLLATACGGSEPAEKVGVPGQPGRLKSAGWVRAERRAFDGAPPVIPHQRFGPPCLSCHNERGMEVAGVGFAPANPHADTDGLSSRSRCNQCHVFRITDEVFVANDFAGLPQRAVPAARSYIGAPPVIPHAVFMRENCHACHDGPAAREEIRCSHPERVHCQQCHVPVTTRGKFLE